MELADLVCVNLSHEGVSNGSGNVTKALVVIMNCGKTNQHGRTEYGSHRDPKSCLVGALAFYFFWRWQAEGVQQFARVQRPQDWYEIKVLWRDAKDRKRLCFPSSALYISL